MPSTKTTAAAAAREDARRDDGRFGEQERREAHSVALDQAHADEDDRAHVGRPEPSSEDLNDARWKGQPFIVAVQPQHWRDDDAVDCGPEVTWDAAPYLATLGADDRLDLIAAARSNDYSRFDLDDVYLNSASMGLVDEGYGPFYVTLDAVDLEEWDAANPHDPTGGADEEGGREAADPVEAYGAARESVERDYAALTEGLEDVADVSTREQRYLAVAAHFEAQTHLAAQAFEPHEIPNPGVTVLSGKFGDLAGAAGCAARARIAADRAYGGGSITDAEQTAADALVAKALDTRDVTTATGIPFRVRLVRPGQSWGRDATLVAAHDTVMVFDARYPHHPPMIGSAHEDRATTERNGQFVSSYYASTLREHGHGAGLNLDTSSRDWRIDGETFKEVAGWLDRRAPLRDNPFADAATTDDVDRLELATAGQTRPAAGSDLLAASTRLTRAREAASTRRREITRGWNSLG